MKRVLEVFLPRDGGVAQHVGHLAEHLSTLGWEAELAGPPDAMVYERALSADITIHRLPYARLFSSPRADAVVLHQLRGLIGSRKYDIVHAHGLKPGSLVRLAVRGLRVPVVYTPHGYDIARVGMKRRAAELTVEHALRPFTDALICVCDDELERAIRHRIIARQRAFRVYNGTEACTENSEPDERLAEMRAAGPLAATVTALRDQKSVDVFLKAAPLVLEQLPEARLAVVGDGPLRPALEQQAARLRLSDDRRFAFLHFEPPSARYLRTIDVFVLSSSWEGFPISILEALACGVPQVATDVGGTREAVTSETGALVPPRDPQALASALVAFMRDRNRLSRLAAASRKRHAERFGVDQMVRRIASIYDRLR
jgi:glycosyltransferase involved in cell wall biosynthesis